MNHHKPSRGFDSWSKEELIEISKRAGVCSGKARRKLRRRINNEKLRQRARQEMLHEEVMAIRRAARALKAAADSEQLR